VINEVHTRLRKFLLSVSDLSDGEQEEAGRWSEFGTGDVPTLGLAFPSIISDSEASWWGAPPQPLMARPCLENGSEGIPPCTTTVGLSGRSCDLLLLYTTMLGTAIINARNYTALLSSGDYAGCFRFNDWFKNGFLNKKILSYRQMRFFQSF